jgi:MFS transporter, SP family, inositol transporter
VDKNRGKVVVFSHVLWAVGILSSLLLGAAFGGLGRLGGQILFAQVGVVAVVVLFLRLRIGESQLWLTARDERRHGITTIRADRVRVRDLFRAPYIRTFAVLAIAYAFMGIGASTWGGFGAFIGQNLANVPVQVFSATALITNVASILAAVWFMRLVDTRWRMPFFVAGTVLIIVGYGVVALLGFSLGTLIASLALTSVGMAFAFETILKVWMQESFPTMLRSTAQGSIMAFARLVPVPIQVATPALLLANGQLFYLGLTLISVIAGAMLWVTFRKRTRSEFDTEQLQDPEVVETSPGAAR